MPDSRWTYDSTRDAGLPNTGEGGYPTCKQWWSDSSKGLRGRVLTEISPSVLKGYKAIAGTTATTTSIEDSLIRNLVSPEKQTYGRRYSSYGAQGVYLNGAGVENVSDSRAIVNSATAAAVGTGLMKAKITFLPAMAAVQQALPMIQSILIMTLIICIPIVMVASGYSFQALMALTMAFFALHFLTFWWELARWLDNRLLTIAYGGEDGDGAWSNFMDPQVWANNGLDDTILSFVSALMFIFWPGVFFGIMSIAGYKLGEMSKGFGLADHLKGPAASSAAFAEGVITKASKAK